ncbi:break repair meiotic recombinase recruitment factor 1 [Mycteria americana]|uniref:break repair meiotic recombinase recruitment factor 1 n=1 Tax=Mycteria americana TaxID=33587 RepID=UPI003F58E06F
MGKRKNEQPPGGDGKCHVPKTKQSFQEDSEVTGDNSLDVTGPAQTGDADGTPKPAAGGVEDRGETTRGSPGSAATNTPRSENGDREAAAPEQSQAGERVPGLLSQEEKDTGIGGGGKSPEAAAPGAASQPESPQRANSAVHETAEDQPVATVEQNGSAGEEPDAKTPTHHGTGNIGDHPEHGSAVPVRGEGAAGREIALPADTPGRSTGSSVPAEVPDPHREGGVNGSEPGERRGDADQSQEPPRPSVVNAEENESGTVSERAAGGEHRENASGERPRATGTNDAVKNVAESWCSPASGIVSAEVSGVCAPSADPKAEEGTAEPESAGAAGTVGPVSLPQGGNASPWKVSGEADAGRKEARGGGTPSAGTSSVPDPAVPAGGNPAGEGEGEGLAEEQGTQARRGTEHAVSAPRTHTQPPARSGDLPRGGGTAESAPTVTAMPGPAPTGTAQPPAAGTGSAVGADPQDETRLAGEPLSPQPELRGAQPLPAADRRDSAVPACELRAAAGRSHAEEVPPLTEGNGPAQPRPRGEEPEGLRPPAGPEDATDVVCGLILELSNLNRLAMSAHRGLEALRRPKPRRSRRPGPVPPHGGRRWKET